MLLVHVYSFMMNESVLFPIDVQSLD